MTHDELTKHAERWLRRVRRCRVVLSNVQSFATREQPDVIGWHLNGYSTLVEVKVSIQDFKRDAKKAWRNQPARGMGQERWYAVPEGFVGKHGLLDIVCPSEGILNPRLPYLGWGVVEFNAKGQPRMWQQPKRFEEFNRAAERSLLVTAVRRVTEGWGREMFGDLVEGRLPGGDRPRKRIAELESEVHRLKIQLRRVMHPDVFGGSGTDSTNREP